MCLFLHNKEELSFDFFCLQSPPFPLTFVNRFNSNLVLTSVISQAYKRATLFSWFLSLSLSALKHFLKLTSQAIAGWLAHYFERVSPLAATQNVIEPKMALESAEAVGGGHGDCA
jgi:hypothetical protein